MADQVLKDKMGRKIATISEANGRLIIKDKMGRKKGEYDPKTNVTKDSMGRKVGSGNLLTTLL